MTLATSPAMIPPYRLWRMGVGIVKLYYLDESVGPTYYVRSGIGINAEVWSEAFLHIQNWRKELRDIYHIPLSKELHATDLLGGRGRPVKEGHRYKGISKEKGVGIFIGGLQHLERIAQALSGGLEIINVSLEKSKYEDIDIVTLERMLNRIDRSVALEGRYVFLVFDEGKETLITRVYRKALVYNPIPSKFGQWETGQRWKNIPPKHIVGGPAFRSSSSDYFLQLADFVAHALLKKDEPPIPRVKKYNIHKAFDILDISLNKKAGGDDAQGIVRR